MLMWWQALILGTAVTKEDLHIKYLESLKVC